MSKESVDTGKKQRKKPKHLFKPGQSGNLKGRPKGSRNKFAEHFITDLYEDWQKHGIKVLADVRKDDPATYLRVAASLIPKELNVKADTRELDALMEKFDDNELDQLIRGLTAVGSTTQSKDDKAEKISRVKPDRIH